VEVPSSNLGSSTYTIVAQWLAQDSYTVKVPGSSPGDSTHASASTLES
jgi:hypothetical protein